MSGERVPAKRVVLLNGSLRGEESSSRKFLAQVHWRLQRVAGVSTDWVSPPTGTRPAPREVLQQMAAADAVVIAFPLFCYSLSGGLTQLLEDFWAAVGEGADAPPAPRGRVYAIVNCAFPEPWIMRDAIRVVRNFCARLGMTYRFSIAIATGPATAATMRVPLLNPKLKRAFGRIVRDIDSAESPPLEDVFVSPLIPKAVIIKIKEHYERKAPQVFSTEAPG